MQIFLKSVKNYYLNNTFIKELSHNSSLTIKEALKRILVNTNTVSLGQVDASKLL